SATTDVDPRKAAVAAAIARVKAKKATQSQNDTPPALGENPASATTDVDPRKAAVAAAIARVKAKKATQSQVSENSTTP
ncbi:electron transport complex subunit RsxC, partial [Yersinia ruckeri]